MTVLFLVRVHFGGQNNARAEVVNEVAWSHRGAPVEEAPPKAPPRAEGDMDYAFCTITDMGRFLRYLGLEFEVRVTVMAPRT
jgi:hypothetical protein